MSDLFSLAGWYILPDLITGWTQTAYYALWYRAGDAKPRPGSQRYASHRTRIHILVILAYLIYTIVEADWKLQQKATFYQALDVPLTVDERGILSRFRRLYVGEATRVFVTADQPSTVQYHPDKIATSENRPLVEAYYVHLKQCRDVLADPAKRFAYDRFGPEVVDWRGCKTYYDFVSRGVRETSMYYLGTTTVLAVFGLVGYMKYASFWKYVAIASLFTFEMYTMTRPHSPWLITHVLNPVISFYGIHQPYVQFQVLALLRKLLISFFIALSQIGPHVVPAKLSADTDGNPSAQQLDRLGNLAARMEQETQRLMALDLMPFVGDAATLNELRGAMRRWLMDNAVRANPQVRDAMGRVLQPRDRSA